MQRLNVVLALAAAFAGGCAGTPAPPANAREAPQLRLAPAQLGRTLALMQHIEVQAPGHAQALDVALEADAAHVRLAVLAMQQVAARLDWDGTTLDETRAPWWPAQVSGARILSDLQLTYWPAATIRAALPAGWSLVEDGAVRELRQGEEVVTTVTRRGEGTVVDLEQHRAPYRLTITSAPMDAASGGGR